MPVMLLTLTIEDAGGDTSPVSVYVHQDDLYTITDIQTLLVAVLWDAVMPMVNGVLVRASVSLGIDISGLPNNTPSAISDVEEKAVFHIEVYGNNRPIIVTLPTAKESIFENSGAGKLVDETNADYSYFQFIMTEDVVDNGIDARDRHDVQTRHIIFGEQKFGKG